MAAITSWTTLNPAPVVYVFAKCIPDTLKHKTTLVTEYDTTFDGHPLFGGMMFRTIERAAATRLDAVAWVNADVILAQDAADAVVGALGARHGPWMLVAARNNVPHRAMDRWDSRDPAKFVRQHGTPHTRGGVDVFVWNRPCKPIVRAPFPPFVRSANVWDNWLVTEAGATRLVADATNVITVGHVDHDTEFTNHGRWGATYTTDPRNRHNRAVLDRHNRGFSPGLGTPNHVHIQLVAGAWRGVHFAAKDDGTRHPARERRVISYADAHVKAFAAINDPSTIDDVLAAHDAATRFAVAPAAEHDVDEIATCACTRARPNGRTVIVAATDSEAYTRLHLLGLPVFYASSTARAVLQARRRGRDAIACAHAACGVPCKGKRRFDNTWGHCATVAEQAVVHTSIATGTTQ